MYTYLLLDQLWQHLTVALCSALLVSMGTLYFIMTRPRKVYLVDFACYKPPPEIMCPKEMFMGRSKKAKFFSEENLSFQKRILERSGLGEKTYFPEALLREPPNPCMGEARKEAEMVMFGAIDDLLAKTGVKAKDIGILVVNCSLFNPTPSLSAMIVNHYKLWGNIPSYNLGGGAAILLSNRSSDRRRSKYQLIHTVRTHNGADDRSYSCAFQQEDAAQKTGVALSKHLMSIAGDALKTNITTLGPLVLPFSELLLFFTTLVATKVLKMKIKPCVPNFKRAFEHFCVHAGGAAVLEEIEKRLELGEWHMEPSRMTLYRFGNTSSSSLWYELAYCEAKGRIRKGDRTWQIAFGSGFKCNSAVWRALKTIHPAELNKPWMDEIHEFPVDVPKLATINA
nr:3-ketoacyl-CoA synthase 20-like [Ipomoea trifida]